MDTDERLRRLEFESLLLRDNIWEITRRFAMLENLVRAHVLGNQNVPASAPSAAAGNPDSASVLELYKRLSNLEFFVQNIQGGGGPDGTDNTSKNEEPVAKANFEGRTTTTNNFRPLQNIPVTSIDYGFGDTMNILGTQRQQQQKQWVLFNPIKTQDQINGMGRVIASSSQVKTNHPIIDTQRNKDNSGSVDSTIQPGTNPNVAQTLPAKPLVNCTKLCGTYTGHVCGHVHSDTTLCPPCTFLMKGLKLTCGHQADFECHQKNNTADFKCPQCDTANKKIQDIRMPPFSLVAKGVKTTTVSSVVEPPPPPPPSIQNDKNDDVVEESWMSVSWLDEDDIGTTASAFPSFSSSNNSQQGSTMAQQTKAVAPAAATSTTITRATNNLSSSEGSSVPAMPSSSSVSTTGTTQKSLSSSSIRTNSSAPSSYGSQNSIASISGSPKLSSVEVLFGNYMKVNGKNKATRKDWITNAFKDYTDAQLNTFLRSLSRYVVKLERGRCAAAGQLLAVLSETKTTKDAIIEAFLAGILSELPKMQIDNKDNFEVVGFNVCYILVAMFNDEKDLGWVLKLGKNLAVTKPLLWGIISTEIMHLLKERKKEHGLLLMWRSTGAEKVPLLQQALAGAKVKLN